MDIFKPSLIFLSEPLLFKSDLKTLEEYINDKYSWSLNSEDSHNPDLSLTSSKTKGGTLVMWRNDLDQYLSVLPTPSPALLPVLLDIPGYVPMIHIAIYLPTSGKEAEYFQELANLGIMIETLQLKYPTSLLFVRGDCNASKTNPKRNVLFSNFIQDLGLSRVDLHHNTYHHFLGHGTSDSEIDVLLFSAQAGVNEKLVEIVCKQENPLVDSHHDLLVSVSTIPSAPCTSPDTSKNVIAPLLANTRHKIKWSQDSVAAYEALVSCHLPRIREHWYDPSSEKSMSILLEVTNMILSQAAIALNKSISLSPRKLSRSLKLPPAIIKSNKRLVRISRRLRNQINDQRYTSDIVHQTREKYQSLKKLHRRLVRRQHMFDCIKRDTDSYSVMTTSSHQFYKKVKASKRSTDSTINRLYVRDRVYEGEEVCNGFYDNILYLKTEAHKNLDESNVFKAANDEYKNILRICSEAKRIPKMTLEQTSKILKSIRPAVGDSSNITGFHYQYSGQTGALHLNILLNSIIDNMNILSSNQLNTVSACILHKGHGKNKKLADSYRTISSCQFLSKCLDSYLGHLYSSIWDKTQANTQFQGKGSSHDLAALLLTEVLQHSLHTSNKPVFVLYLDAQSAFDLVLWPLLINKLYHQGVNDQGLLLIDQRLKHRKTICEWNGKLMGPICDSWGLEQGGRNSSDLYKVYNNEQLDEAQSSGLGVDLGGKDPLIVSAIGQADDVALVSSDIFALQSLLDLSLRYCKNNHVTLRAEKTKLQVFSNKKSSMAAYYARVISPINVNGTRIPFVEEAEHVGVLRSTSGNQSHILDRFTAHKKCMAAVLPFGLSRGHRTNPAASLHIHRAYCTPVLLSGLSSLVLSQAEVALVDKYLKVTLQNLQRLMDKTPECVVYFLAGSLPGVALLHLRQLNSFGMITRLSNSPLLAHAKHILTSAKQSASSWFQQIRGLCLQYQLPHPLDLIASPIPKQKFNRMVKRKVVVYWELHLRARAMCLSSIPYFNPNYMSLTKPHSLWTSCGPNPFECHKATIAARMLSGRYLTDKLQRHWTQNKDGICLLDTCVFGSEGTLEHILLRCQALSSVRYRLLSLAAKVSFEHPYLYKIISEAFLSNAQDRVMQLILDCSSIPFVIHTTHILGPVIRDRLHYLGRTWCYNIHRERMHLLGLLDFR